MKIETKKISSAIKKLHDVASIISTDSKELLIMFHENKNIIYSTEEVFITAKIDHGLDDCTLPLSKLNKLVTSYNKEDEIEIFSSSNKFNIRRTGKTKGKASLAYIEGVEIPIRREPTKWLRLPEDFINGIKSCSISIAARNDTNWILTHYGVFKDKILSTDILRGTMYKFKEREFDDSFALPSSIAKTLEAFSFDRYTLDRRSIWFCNDVYSMQFARLSESYPSMDRAVFKTDKTIKLDSLLFMQALERSIIFAKGDNPKSKEISITLDGKSYSMESKNDYGENIEKGRLKTRYEGFITLRLNPVFLLEITKQINEPILKIGIENDRLVFSKDTMQHVIALNS